jgi:lysophospholipase L1-like esterase
MRKTLIITNIITGILLLVLLLLNKYPQRVYNRIDAYFNDRPLLKPHSFLDNESYLEATDFYTTYNGQKNIVMLGNSLTYRINWGELVGRTDIANRGIGSDITSGYMKRLNFVLNLNPKICFIEGGVNDLGFTIHQDTTIKNLNAIVDTLVNNKIKPVLTTVTYVTKAYNDAINFNQKIKELNQQIIKLAKEKKILLIDLNTRLKDGEFLKTEYSIGDGIHFTSKAYLIWKEEILKILEQEKI